MATPQLRFKEFDGDWTNKPLSQFTAKKNQKNKDALIIEVLTNSATQGIIKQSDYFEREIVTEANLNGYYVVDIDDFVYNPRISVHAPVGPIKRNHQCLGVMSPLYTVFKIDDGNLSFFEHFFESEVWHDYIKNVSNTGARHDRMNIGNKDFFNMPIYLPSLEEQSKIASFLSAVDEKISQLTQKHELLSQYKQGMMQKLFSQQIRFKADDGCEFEEWEEKVLIDSVDTNIKWSFTGGPFGSNLKSDDYTESGIRIIQLQNIGDGLFLNDYKIYTSLKKADELLSCNIYPNEILISKMGDPVARCCIVPNHHNRYVMCSDGIRLVVDKKRYLPIFMFYQINYQDFRQSASDVSTGSTRKRIGLSDLKQLPIKVPSLEEQTKIANFLSAIDQKIEVVAQQIEQAKQWKKGLLQQMFV